jgi:hypothetical protein
MRDTSQEIDAAFTALFAGCSEVDRLKMTCRMFDDAKALVAAGIESESPGLSAAERRRRMFERLYYGDFDERTKAFYLAALE